MGDAASPRTKGSAPHAEPPEDHAARVLRSTRPERRGELGTERLLVEGALTALGRAGDHPLAVIAVGGVAIGLAAALDARARRLVVGGLGLLIGREVARVALAKLRAARHASRAPGATPSHDA